MYFGMFDPTMILLFPAILLAFFAQGKVNSAYRKYAGIRNNRGITGAQAARKILDRNGLYDVTIEITSGRLSDHYDPRHKKLRLSPDVHNNASIAAVGIAAHETGHALQHSEGYAPLAVRNAIVPVVNIGSMLSWPLIFIGFAVVSAGHYTQGNLVLNIGIIFFMGVVLFHAITLPVEFNASSRARKLLDELGIVDSDEDRGVKKVLSAAAMTYVAALAVAIANLIRILIIRGRE